MIDKIVEISKNVKSVVHGIATVCLIGYSAYTGHNDSLLRQWVADEETGVEKVLAHQHDVDDFNSHEQAGLEDKIGAIASAAFSITPEPVPLSVPTVTKGKSP